MKNPSLRKTTDWTQHCTCAMFIKYGQCDHTVNMGTVTTTSDPCPHLHLAEMQGFLPYFIDAEFKKGKSKNRGMAILHVTLFLDWCKKNVKIKK